MQMSSAGLWLASTLSVFCTAPWSLPGHSPHVLTSCVWDVCITSVWYDQVFCFLCVGVSQYMYHWIPLKVTAFGWGKPSFQLYLCHFLSLWLWTSTSTSWEFNSPFRRGKVSLHGWGFHETMWKAIWKCKVLPVLASHPLTPPPPIPLSPAPPTPTLISGHLAALGSLSAGKTKYRIFHMAWPPSNN